MQRVSKPPIPNRLLAALPVRDYGKLLHHLEAVDLAFGQVLHEPRAPIRHVYFPSDCVVSLMTAVDGGGRHTEVGLLGSDGMVGLSAALGTAVSPHLAVVQREGGAMRMRTGEFQSALAAQPALQRALLAFTHLLMIQVCQTAACNRFHVVSQRLARWLLMTRDRISVDEFRVKQEFLAAMLGVRRGGVSEAAGALQKRGLIGYSRGRLTILNRRGLAAASCGCYKAVNDFHAASDMAFKAFPGSPAGGRTRA